MKKQRLLGPTIQFEGMLRKIKAILHLDMGEVSTLKAIFMKREVGTHQRLTYMVRNCSNWSWLMQSIIMEGATNIDPEGAASVLGKDDAILLRGCHAHSRP